MMLTALLAFALGGQAFSAEPGKTAAANPLWVVEKGDAKVYLFGAIHLMSEKSYPLPAAIERAYKQSAEIVFEADMRALNRPDTQVRLTQSGTYPAGQTLRDSVSPATYERVTARFAAAGLPAERMNRYRPWFCGITLTMLEIRRLGYDLQHGAEQRFFARALQDGKRIASFESLDENFAVFTGLSPDEDEETLLQTLDDLDMAKRDAEKLRNAWKNGDVPALEQLLHASLAKHPIIRERLFGERNRNWLPLIEARLKSGNSSMVVIGAAHLLGENGLLELLRKAGHKVRQL